MSVFETSVTSPTGKYLYSDRFFEAGELKIEKLQKRPFFSRSDEKFTVEKKAISHYHGILNKLVRYPVIGILAAISRLGLSVIHIIGHTFAALITQKKGHLFHALKGGCELLRSSIEIIPIFGRMFTCLYSFEPGTDKDYYLSSGVHAYNINDSQFWLMKIYNPNHPDMIDTANKLWEDPYKPKSYIKG